MTLKAGDMVSQRYFTIDTIELFDSPPGPLYHEEKQVCVIKRGDTAVVISLDRIDGRCVYILGPHGAGWSFSSFFERIDPSPKTPVENNEE